MAWTSATTSCVNVMPEGATDRINWRICKKFFVWFLCGLNKFEAAQECVSRRPGSERIS